MKDYYRILGLKETATAEEIHKRWIELMQKFHPDHGMQCETDDETTKEINEAYQVLKHSSSRMEYDFERFHERKEKKISTQKLVFAVSGLVFIFILGFFFMKKPQTPAPLKSKPQLPSSSQAKLSPIPQYEPGPYVEGKFQIAETEKMAKVEKGEKIVLPKKGKEMKTASEIPKKKVEPPLKIVQSQVTVKSLSSLPPKESNPVLPIDNLSPMKPSGPSERISVARDVSSPSPPAKVEAQVAEINPTPRIAMDEEVKRFFADYVERYNQKDIQGFISFFSSKAIQNQKDGLEGIRRIYDNFFNQSQGLEYHIENIKIEVDQNSVQVKAQYEIDQILKKEEGRKIWRGHIQWILAKEEGVLKITSLNYKNDESP